jgi:glutaconate CoA-transferase subunit B
MPAIEEMKHRDTPSDIRATEIMAAAGARELRDGEVVIVGLGLPEIATVLAKRTHAPGLSTLLEVGVMNPIPKDTPIGLGDSRIFYRATCWSGFLDVMGMNLHRGVVDVGFLGALEVDRYGDINTTLLKQESGKVRYVNGSAGGNDVASLAKRVIVIMRHEKRKLPLAVAHLTSPGFVGGRSRQELGLRGGGPSRIITDMAVLGFDPQTHAASLLSLHPGVRVEELIENTGFPLHIPDEVPTTPLPTPEQLRLLREEIDPRGVHLK